MARQRRQKGQPAGKRVAPQPAAATLLELTRRGFDALKERRSPGGSGRSPSVQAREFADAVDRLKADYERLLTR